MSATDEKICALLRRSGWPEPERGAPGLPTSHETAAANTQASPAAEKSRSDGIGTPGAEIRGRGAGTNRNDRDNQGGEAND